MTIARWTLGATVLLGSSLAIATSSSGCGSSDESTFGLRAPTSSSSGTSGSSSFGGSSSGGEGGAGCTGLQCQVKACSGGGATTISGVVLDPAGKLPLYDVAVYVPNTTPQPFKEGASCEPCSALYSGDPITSALTDASGAFTLTNVPDGTNIPLVIQIGKWRKQLTIPTVQPCVDNPQPKGTLKLPSRHDEPGADIPRIAISTGGSDTLECLLQRVGLDRSEYQRAGSGGGGRIEIFAGGAGNPGQHAIPNTSPPAPDSYQALWDKKEDLLKYDMVLLSCEGQETANPNQQALYDYANAGGRVFASHFHYAFFDTGPFDAPPGLASWSPGSNNYDNTIFADIVTTLSGGAAFPKGQAMKDWLTNASALQNGKLPIVEGRHNAVVGPQHTASQAWIVKTDESPNQTEYFSVNTPTASPDDQKCGRVVFSDLHVGAASGDDPDQPVPTGCAQTDLSAQEKALEFMLFDLSSCVTPNGAAPEPPAVVK